MTVEWLAARLLTKVWGRRPIRHCEMCGGLDLGTSMKTWAKCERKYIERAKVERVQKLR